MRPIVILAWGQHWNEIETTVLTTYEQRYPDDETFSLIFASYAGGAQFFENVTTSEQYVDVVIADREIIYSMSREGRLVNLLSEDDEPSSESGDWTSKSYEWDAKFPEWLRSWAIRSGQYLYAVPIRWGLLGCLVATNFFKRIKPGQEPQVEKLLTSARSTLLWSPGGYFLPTLTSIAVAVNKDRPNILTDEELTRFRGLVKGFAEAGNKIDVASSLSTFFEQLKQQRPDYIPCAGDFVVNSALGSTDNELKNLIRKEYRYLYPESGRPMAFFEMGAVMATTRSRQRAIRVLKILADSDVRERVTSLPYTDSYTANDSADDATVYGPDYDRTPAKGQLTRAIPRRLPSDPLLTPKLAEWSRIWRTLLMREGS